MRVEASWDYCQLQILGPPALESAYFFPDDGGTITGELQGKANRFKALVVFSDVPVGSVGRVAITMQQGSLWLFGEENQVKVTTKAANAHVFESGLNLGCLSDNPN